MGLTNFQNGISSFGVPVHGSGDLTTTGNVYFVDSGQANASDSHKGTDSKKALLTLDAAVGKCTANNGDIIVLMPGHAESVTTAAAIDLDVAGITIKGFGSGSSRPTFTFDTTTSVDIDIDAANITIENVLFEAGIDAVAAAIDVNATDFTLRNCEFRDTTGYKTALWIDVPLVASTGEADRLRIEGCTVKQNLVAGAASFVRLMGGHDGLVIKDNNIRGNYSVSPISNTSTALTNLKLEANIVENTNATNLCVTLLGTTDGTISDNHFRSTSSIVTITADNDCSLFENYVVTTDGRTGVLLGTLTT